MSSNNSKMLTHSKNLHNAVEALLTGHLKMDVVPQAMIKPKHIRPRQHRNKGPHDNEANMDGSIGV